MQIELTGRKFFSCFVGMNPKGEKRFGILARVANVRPPHFRLLSYNYPENDCIEIIEALNRDTTRGEQVLREASNYLNP